MIITNQFVVLNNPKTGSTFVRKVLRAIYEKRASTGIFNWTRRLFGISEERFKELVLPNIKRQNKVSDQHGTYSQIPDEYKGRPVVSVVRNPFDRLMSSYEFRHWERNPPIKGNLIKEYFPHFPNLSFNEHITLMGHSQREIHTGIEMGVQTIQFIQMFFTDPDTALENIDDD